MTAKAELGNFESLTEEKPALVLLKREISKLNKFIDSKGLIIASTPDGQFPAYFARDTTTIIILSLEAAKASPVAYRELENNHFFKVFRKNLVFLAQNQGQVDNPETEGEIGKILHEIREGPENQIVLAGLRKGGWPVEGEDGNLRMRYFGSIDSTPLWLTTIHRYCETTGDYTLAEELAPQIEMAAQYLLKHEDPETGLVIFESNASQGGLTHQSWMDSAESNPPPPIYYSEVQGYYYQANLCLAELLRRRDPNSELASRLEERAKLIKEGFNRYFYWPREGYFYSAIQKLENGQLKPVRERRSNPAHGLYFGIINQERISLVANRLMHGDIFGPCGVQTLSLADSPKFDPFVYHNGPPWPHDNALIALGLRKMGYHKYADRICSEILDQLYSLGSAYEFILVKDDKPTISENEISEAKPPPNRHQAWALAAEIYDLASTPSYTPPEYMFDPKRNARFKLPKYHG